MGLTSKQRAFVEEYLGCWNATEAARRIGYKQPNMAGPRLILKDSVKAAIQERIAEKSMSADEVLQRLAEHARGDLGDLMDIESMSFDIDLAKAKELGLTRLIKKVKQRTITTSNKDGEESETNIQEIELYDAQAALALLAKYHGLLIDRTDLTSKGESIIIKNVGFDVDKL